MTKVKWKIDYLHLSTWPLHVRLWIVHSIIMDVIQLFLSLLIWNEKSLQTFISSIIEMLWQTSSSREALRLSKMEHIRTPKLHGGLKILEGHYNKLTRGSTVILTFFEQSQPWVCICNVCTLQTEFFWAMDYFLLGHVDRRCVQ